MSERPVDNYFDFSSLTCRVDKQTSQLIIRIKLMSISVF